MKFGKSMRCRFEKTNFPARVYRVIGESPALSLSVKEPIHRSRKFEPPSSQCKSIWIGRIVFVERDLFSQKLFKTANGRFHTSAMIPLTSSSLEVKRSLCSISSSLTAFRIPNFRFMYFRNLSCSKSSVLQIQFYKHVHTERFVVNRRWCMESRRLRQT